MRCPSCDHPEDRVLDSRPLESASVIRRRRVCLHCGKRFTTYERVESTPLMVIKRDNRREPFSRDKMREGIQRACQKRPISPAAIEKLMAEVEYGLQDYVLEVPSVEIGQRILKRLYDLDAVAYVRFASVYRSFGDVDTFLSELRKVKRAHQKRARLTSRISGTSASLGPMSDPALSASFSLHPIADRSVSVETDRLAKV
ncbi:MAG: transcriptional repressor NrdR [Elusimicrobia bacterium]|nr:transcriptional repressor NrdR [Elusimicrobiota bacterium]